MPLRQLTDVDDIERLNAAFASEVERIKALSDVYLPLPRHLASVRDSDPFGAQYLTSMRRWLEEITGRPDYDPAQNELAPYLQAQVESESVLPGIYSYGDSAMLGDMLQAFGAVLRALDVKSGHSVLEYGAGDGQICLNLARMGCRVTAVDIEQRYLDLIRAQAFRLGTEIRTIHAPFGSAEPGCVYDRILFFEAFHHALAHQELALQLRQQLAFGGAVVFAGEPILATDSYYRPALPYAWGPRLDGLSLRAMRAYGWCELGFAREYFVELLMRSGFAVELRRDLATDRGTAYIATRTGATVDLASHHLLETAGRPNCWHAGEGNIRWSRAPTAGIPIDRASGWRRLTLDIHNFMPLERDIRVQIGARQERVRLAAGQSAAIELPVTSDGGPLELTCDVQRPRDLIQGHPDDRCLGVAVSRLRYDA